MAPPQNNTVINTIRRSWVQLNLKRVKLEQLIKDTFNAILVTAEQARALGVTLEWQERSNKSPTNVTDISSDEEELTDVSSGLSEQPVEGCDCTTCEVCQGCSWCEERYCWLHDKIYHSSREHIFLAPKNECRCNSKRTRIEYDADAAERDHLIYSRAAEDAKRSEYNGSPVAFAPRT
jgi:hypothetical protein